MADEPGKRGWIGKLRASAFDALSEAGVKGRSAASSAGDAIRGTTQKAKETIAQSAVVESAAKASRIAGEHFDTLSGAAVLQLVEERLELQARYNDLLATKLDEALERIAQLEKRTHAGPTDWGRRED